MHENHWLQGSYNSLSKSLVIPSLSNRTSICIMTAKTVFYSRYYPQLSQLVNQLVSQSVIENVNFIKRCPKQVNKYHGLSREKVKDPKRPISLMEGLCHRHVEWSFSNPWQWRKRFTTRLNNEHYSFQFSRDEWTYSSLIIP